MRGEPAPRPLPHADRPCQPSDASGAPSADQPPATGGVKNSCACVVGKTGPRQNDSATVAGNATPGAQADAPASQEIDIQCARAGTDAHAVCQRNTANGLERERSIATTGLGDIGIDRDG